MQAVSIPFIHAFMMKALDRAGNTALNSQAAAQLQASGGWERGIYIVIRERKSQPSGGKPLTLRVQLLSVRLLKVTKSRFPQGGEGSLPRFIVSRN